MAQLISSLKKYLIGLFKRIYKRKEYLVKAEGNSPIEHNFRECPNCHARVSSLDPIRREQKCSCGQILHRKGKYEDEKRIFILQRPLYGKLFSITLTIFLLCIFFNILIFRILPVPNGYIKPDLDMVVGMGTGMVLFIAGFILFMAADSLEIIVGKPILWIPKPVVFIVALLIPFSLWFLLFSLQIDQIKGYSAVPFWTDIPTQQEVYDSQKQEVDQMKPTAERYYVAKKYSANPQIDLMEELLLVAENDFPGLMKKYDIDAKSLKRGSDEEARLYKSYLSYLNFLQAMDMHAFQNQCIADPWNMLTAGVANSYPEVAATCR